MQLNPDPVFENDVHEKETLIKASDGVIGNHHIIRQHLIAQVLTYVGVVHGNLDASRSKVFRGTHARSHQYRRSFQASATDDHISGSNLFAARGLDTDGSIVLV